jgi:hypothetical protein
MMAGVIIEYHIYSRTGVECEHDSQKNVGYTPRPFEANWGHRLASKGRACPAVTTDFLSLLLCKRLIMYIWKELPFITAPWNKIRAPNKTHEHKTGYHLHRTKHHYSSTG